MQLNPVYGDDAVMRIDGLIDDPTGPMVRQRARLAGELALLDDEQWSTESRCAGWSVQDVVAHLVTTNRFWAASIAAGRDGSPTRMLQAFDPVTTPALLVESTRTSSPADVLDRFVTTADELEAAVRDIDEAALTTVAEAPPGHVAIRLVVLHALWDSWIHERDILLPLGLKPVIEPDEVVGSLVYAAALGPALHAANGRTDRGTMQVSATDPDASFVVELDRHVSIRSVDAPAGTGHQVRGDATELLEALSYRTSMDALVPISVRWMVDGLGLAFDQV
jgi:uncharacterized protein (TIGR03083 family)